MTAARRKDMTVWEMEKVKQSQEGYKTYTYWMASWREGGKTRNVHLGSPEDGCRRSLAEARKMKAEAIYVN